MTLLRLLAPLSAMPSRCQWALVAGNGRSSMGAGTFEDLPRRVDRVQLVIPASDVLIARTKLPPAARKSGSSVLAFAVEERMASDPEANEVAWLGTQDGMDLLAVLGKPGLVRWRKALASRGIHAFEVQAESLLLPWAPGQWSLAWNGKEGFVRTGKLEAVSTDSGDRESPPMVLSALLESAGTAHRPHVIKLYPATSDAVPDVERWQGKLGLPIDVASPWEWAQSDPANAISLYKETRDWKSFSGIASRLRWPGYLVAAALLLHAIGLVVSWFYLSEEQRTLRNRMEARFRATFSDATTVVDPLLQMRRKLAEVRHAAGKADPGDFLPLIEQVSGAMATLPPGTIRLLAYEGGRVTLELAAADAGGLAAAISNLRERGLEVERASPSSGAGRTALTIRVP